jgi:hypothetical protein
MTPTGVVEVPGVSGVMPVTTEGWVARATSQLLRPVQGAMRWWRLLMQGPCHSHVVVGKGLFARSPVRACKSNSHRD